MKIQELYDAMDEIYENMNQEELKIIPTVDMLKQHDVVHNIDKYAPFLLYLEEKIRNKEIEDYDIFEDELNATLTYIREVFSEAFRKDGM